MNKFLNTIIFLILGGVLIMSCSGCNKKDMVAIIKTNLGDIEVNFYQKEAPKAVENFITHAKNGYYDNLVFHRVIKDFMIQGGDPTGTGCGGESIWGEPFEDEFSDKVKNDYGALSMANSGPNTNGSQFFIVQNKDGAEWLNGRHTVFGHVVKGYDVLDKIANQPTDANDRPTNDVVIKTIEIK